MASVRERGCNANIEDRIRVSSCCLQFAVDWQAARADKDQGTILTLPVLRANSGGLIVRYNSLQGFVPNPLLSPAHWCKGSLLL